LLLPMAAIAAAARPRRQSITGPALPVCLS
jgi:hypothetical protein